VGQHSPPLAPLGGPGTVNPAAAQVEAAAAAAAAAAVSHASVAQPIYVPQGVGGGVEAMVE